MDGRTTLDREGTVDDNSLILSMRIIAAIEVLGVLIVNAVGRRATNGDAAPSVPPASRAAGADVHVDRPDAG